MSDGINRRAFLRRSLLTSAALSSSALEVLAACRTPTKPTSAPRKVIVVGAGLAGLAAGYELTRAGHEVTILEAQKRTGGRVLTLREFADGLYADAGAARIPADHDWTLKYVREFSLPLVPFYPRGGLYTLQRRGSRSEVGWKRFTEVTEESVGVRLGDAAQWFRIEGGNDLLPGAFAARLGEKITYGVAVKRIEQDAGGVRVRFVREGSEGSARADYLVCAVPFTLLRRMEVTPPFSKRKREVVRGLNYHSAARVLLQFRRRFWEGGTANGFGLVTDLPAEVWPASFGQPGARGLLQSYLRHGASLEASKLDERGRVGASLERMEQVLPGARENFESGASKFWHEDEWARGAWGLTEDDEELERVVRPEGRVHFAGEHASAWPSWMQGALESGHRAAREISEAARRTASLDSRSPGLSR
jgi:monoamine oxidase